MPVVFGVPDAALKHGLPVPPGLVIRDLFQKQFWRTARDIHREVHTALPFQETELRARAERREGEKGGEEDGGVDRVHVEEVKLDLLGRALGGYGVVYCSFKSMRHLR